jgi:hypothetical protein
MDSFIRKYKMNLVIGNTSQLSRYFPDNFIKISSRNLEDSVFEQSWERVFLCFAEQRTYMNKDNLFDKINIEYTKYIIKRLKANSIIYYSTAELWNNTCGEVDIDSDFNYHLSDYVVSKSKITNYIKENYKNVLIAYPFNFNSKYRLPPFLFGKVFDSIINKKKIDLGDTYYYRELLHPSFVVQESMKQTEHKVIGTGRLIFINDFIRSLYNSFGMKYEDYVTEDLKNHSIYRKNIFYAKERKTADKLELFKITLKEINDQIANKAS